MGSAREPAQRAINLGLNLPSVLKPDSTSGVYFSLITARLIY